MHVRNAPVIARDRDRGCSLVPARGIRRRGRGMRAAAANSEECDTDGRRRISSAAIVPQQFARASQPHVRVNGSDPGLTLV